jgi:Tol biopolymer transport system component
MVKRALFALTVIALAMVTGLVVRGRSVDLGAAGAAPTVVVPARLASPTVADMARPGRSIPSVTASAPPVSESVSSISPVAMRLSPTVRATEVAATVAIAPIPCTVAATPAASAPVGSVGKLAFVQQGDIWVQNLPDGKPQRLTTGGRKSDVKWSTSGQWLAYRDGEALWVMSSSGRSSRQVTPNWDIQFAWSPVGDRIAVEGRDGLFTEDATGTKRFVIVPPTGSDLANVYGVAWSPAGDWLAYGRIDDFADASIQCGRCEHNTLWRAHPDGSGAIRLADAGRPSMYRFNAIGWSPDGAHIIVNTSIGASLDSDGTGIEAIPATGGAPTLRSGVMVAAEITDYAWAPDGQHLALVEGYGRSLTDNKAIYLHSLAGESIPLSDPGRVDLNPAWSPSAYGAPGLIAYSSAPVQAAFYMPDPTHLPPPRQIWLMSADGSHKCQLTDAPGSADTAPQWSTDGGYLLFARRTGDVEQLWLTDVTGTKPRLIVGEVSGTPGTYLDHLYDWWKGAHP